MCALRSRGQRTTDRRLTQALGWVCFPGGVCVMPQPSLYLETTIPSYLTASPSRDILVLARQELTRRWWEGARAGYQLVTSPAVIAEAGRGDPEAARKRLELMDHARLLDARPEVDELAVKVRRALNIPEKAALDAYHLAFSMFYEIDYLLTWNCAHLANAGCIRLLARFARGEGIWLPVICTPEQMVPEGKGSIDV